MKTLILFLMILCISCHSEKQGKPSYDELVIEIPEDFLKFYNSFHSDSLFQMAHIIFPLEASSDSTKWLKADWRLHKPFDSQSGEFTRQFDNLGGIIVELMQDQTKTVTIERRFSKMGEEYQLIYYRIKSTFGS